MRNRKRRDKKQAMKRREAGRVEKQETGREEMKNRKRIDK